MSMVRDAIDDVDIFVVAQSRAGEIGALKAPGHMLLAGALSKAVPAVLAEDNHAVGKTAIAADFSQRDIVFARDFFHHPGVIFAGSQVLGTGPAVNPADTDQVLRLLVFHRLPPHTTIRIPS
jgi:hypothetical protein